MTIDFSAYERKSPEKIESSNDSTIDFSQYGRPDVQQEPEESPFSTFLRVGSQLGSRAAEGILGMPRDLNELAKMGAVKIPEWLAGKELPALRGAVNTPGVFDSPFLQPPSSQDLREFSEDITNDYTTPQNELEEYLGDTAQLATQLGLGGPTGVAARLPATIRPLAYLGTAAAAEGAKKGVEKLGGGDKLATAAQLGVLVPLTMINPGGALRFSKNLLDNSRRAIPQGAAVSSQSFNAALRNLRARINRGMKTDQKRGMTKDINSLIQKGKNGNISIEDLFQAKQDINALRGQYGEFQGLENLYNEAHKIIDDAIDLYGRQNPGWVKQYRRANEAFGVTSNTARATNWITGPLKFTPRSAGLSALLGSAVGAGGKIGTVLSTAVGGLAGAGAALAGALPVQAAARMIQSPELRRYYIQMMEGAFIKNAAKAYKNARKLDKELYKQENEINQ